MEHKEYRKRNKGGRPKKETAEKLSYRIGVKMAAADYFRLLTQAYEAGISTSLRERQTPEGIPKSVGTARWRWQGFMNL